MSTGSVRMSTQISGGLRTNLHLLQSATMSKEANKQALYEDMLNSLDTVSN